MFRFLCLFLLTGLFSFSQTNSTVPSWFKGDHFVIYTKCKTAVLFCESTQQDYIFCGASKNCQGLYVMPGDTFLLNYEDKLQSKTIVADISFQNFLPPVAGYTFSPVSNCIPPQPLQVIIPLQAVSGSSFQVNAQNASYAPAESFQPWIPLPIYVYVGGQQPANTSALSAFTNCPQPADTTGNDVSVKELADQDNFSVFPNPAKSSIKITSQQPIHQIEVIGITGQVLVSETVNIKEHKLTVNNLAGDIYFIKCTYANGMSLTKKLIVSH